MKTPVKVLFASGSEDLIPTAIEHMLALYPELPLVVVSEFPPDQNCRWIPYHVRRTFGENWELCRASLEGSAIRISAAILQPRMPYWKMRAIAFLLSPWNFLAFNENFGHFMLRPRSILTILRHMLWRTRNFLVWEFSPGGSIFTFLWRLTHPRAFRRPLIVLAANLAGHLVALRKMVALRKVITRNRPLPARSDQFDQGVSVIIPTRNGKDLLARILPRVINQLADLRERCSVEVIVVDNGSMDGTVDYLRADYPEVVCICVPQPLSFSRAINRGLEVAQFSHVCLLNNDMLIAPGFFESLIDTFARVPDLFCATAQIFLPEGAAREETGKAVMPGPVTPTDFPIRCDLPIPGETHTYVLYGSGGCSLFDTTKLRQLEGLDPIYEPAYVEDLDLGVRGWQQNWPTVFVSQAQVLHSHRATTSRYYTRDELGEILELNYLRFLARTVADPRTFRRMWIQAVRRLNLLAARTNANPSALRVLEQARYAFSWCRDVSPGSVLSDDELFALGSGAIAVFPGAKPRHKQSVLVISPYLPYPLSHGGAVRMYNLMSRAASDFDQVLISFVDTLGPVPEEILAICAEVVTVKRVGSHARPSTSRPDVVEEFDSPSFHAAIRQTVRKWHPAIAQLEFTQMAQYAADCAPAKTLLVEHDITLDLVQQLLAQGEDWELRHQLPRWINFEQAAWSNVDAVITMSQKDCRMVQDRHAYTLPNGVDVKRFLPTIREPEPNRLLFIGSFAHLPNILAIDFFLREVWPALTTSPITLHIVAGARHKYYLDRQRDRIQVDLHRPGIKVEDFVEDVRQAYENATVVIAPLLASAGTNIKIMEAMAMGKAIVSTRAGINGLDLEAGRDLLVADTAQDLAQAIRELLANPERRKTLEHQARRTAIAAFDWDIIAQRQKQIYEELGRLRAPR